MELLPSVLFYLDCHPGRSYRTLVCHVGSLVARFLTPIPSRRPVEDVKGNVCVAPPPPTPGPTWFPDIPPQPSRVTQPESPPKPGPTLSPDTPPESLHATQPEVSPVPSDTVTELPLDAASGYVSVKSFSRRKR